MNSTKSDHKSKSVERKDCIRYLGSLFIDMVSAVGARIASGKKEKTKINTLKVVVSKIRRVHQQEKPKQNFHRPEIKIKTP